MQIGERMKIYYEKPFNYVLPRRLPVIIRIDGKTFHTFTKNMQRPFDENFISNMMGLAQHLCEEISTTQFAYCQSDEISLLLHPYKKLDTEPYFGNEIQKICSIVSATASSYFSLVYKKQALFDARCFVLPEDEVVNYFVWRQQDATRNSVSMVAQSKFSHKQLHKKNTKEKQEMLFQEHGINWSELPNHHKRGFAITKGEGGFSLDYNIPIFTQDRDYINKYLDVVEE